MPRELITLMVGQCGNQIGYKFWENALKEHANYSKGKGIYDECLSSFFRNVSSSGGNNLRYDPFKKNELESLKARAVLIDMEEGVLKSLLKGSVGELFDSEFFIQDVSGAGNNWAHGHEIYGPKYESAILNCLRKNAEMCDSLQCFLLMHSLGGGTGSGLGTYILQLLRDDYPDIYRFCNVVFPSEDDDVITSPYNSVLALNELTEYADCVLPIENQALFDMVGKIDQIVETNTGRGRRQPKFKKEGSLSGERKENPFDRMNNIAAHLLTNLTSSMRFPGKLNVDLNEISMNLVPFPKLHYIIPSLAPLVVPKDLNLPSRRLDQMFLDSFDRDYQLMKCDPKHHRYLACGLIVRGNVQISDLNRNIKRMKKDISMIHWNKDGFKIGLCNTPPLDQPYSLLCLSNNCCIKDRFYNMEQRFNKIFQRKYYLHHYTEHGSMVENQFIEARESLRSLYEDYKELEISQPPEKVLRFVPEL